MLKLKEKIYDGDIMCLVMIVMPYVLKSLNNIQQFRPKLNECEQFLIDELLAYTNEV